MFSAISDTIAAYSRALGLIFQHGLMRYIILPGLITLAVMTVFVGGVWTWFANSSIEAWLINATPEWGKWIVEGLADVLVFIVLLVSVFFLAKYIVMVVVAPFMGPLSEKVENIVTGRQLPSTANFIGDLVRGLQITFRNIFLELFLTFALLLMNFIPVVGQIAGTALTFLIQSYFAGFGNMDYTLERKNFSVQDSVQFVRRHRWAAIGNGAVFLLIFLVPVAGWFLAPAFATVAGTVMVLKRLGA